ncbi:MAG: sensor histidine kinase [Planctomycetota bacterium]
MLRARRKQRRLSFDKTTLLAGLLLGLLPACLLVVVPYFYLAGLDSPFFRVILAPHQDRALTARNELNADLQAACTDLQAELRDAIESGATTPPGNWDLVRRIEWRLDHELITGSSSRFAPSIHPALDESLSALTRVEGEERRELLQKLASLPIVDVDPVGFSPGLEAQLLAPSFDATALDGDFGRELLLNAERVDPASLLAAFAALGGRVALSGLALPIDVTTAEAPLRPGLQLAEADPSELRIVTPHRGGQLILGVAAEALVRRCFNARFPDAAATDGSFYYLCNIAAPRPESDASGAPQRYWARESLQPPFDQTWEIWDASRGPVSLAPLKILEKLGWLHYVYGGLLLLAILTVSSLLLAALFSSRVEGSRQKDDFVRLVSHELRTPIAAIRVIVETLSLNRVRGDSERRQFLAQLEDESLRVTDLVERVLEYGKSAGEREVVTDPGDLVDAAVDRYRERMGPEAGVIAVRCAQQFRPVLLDRESIMGVVFNLISNARKFSTRDAPIEISVGEGSQHLFVEVRDHGPGIPAREQKRIFRPFYRGSNAGKTSGFGLGLAYCAQVARSHGGRISVVSSPGAGARFIFEIPSGRESTERSNPVRGLWAAARNRWYKWRSPRFAPAREETAV